MQNRHFCQSPKPSPPQAPTRGLRRLQLELLLPPLKCESWQSVALPRPPLRARAKRTRPRVTRGRGVSPEGMRRRASGPTGPLPSREGEGPRLRRRGEPRRGRSSGTCPPGGLPPRWVANGPAVSAAGRCERRPFEGPEGAEPTGGTQPDISVSMRRSRWTTRSTPSRKATPGGPRGDLPRAFRSVRTSSARLRSASRCPVCRMGGPVAVLPSAIRTATRPTRLGA